MVHVKDENVLIYVTLHVAHIHDSNKKPQQKLMRPELK